jgi:hypothetical protein
MDKKLERLQWLENVLPWDKIKRERTGRCGGRMSRETVQIATEELYDEYQAAELGITPIEFGSYVANPPSKRAKESKNIDNSNGNTEKRNGEQVINIKRGHFREWVEALARLTGGVLPGATIGNAIAVMAGFSAYLYTTTLSDMAKNGWKVEDHGEYFIVDEPKKRLPENRTPEEDEQLAKYLEYIRRREKLEK